MNTPISPQPSATGAHTRLRLKRFGLAAPVPFAAIEIHATLESFDRQTGAFTAFLDTDPQGTPAETFVVVPRGTGQSTDINMYQDSKGFFWQVL